MRFKDFLLNENLPRHVQKQWDVSDAPKEEAIKWLLENNKEMLTRGLTMYRGDNKITTGSRFIDPSVGYRNSLTSNVYQLLMDGSKDMKDIPSRSGSLICTTSKYHADDYGHRCFVFPKKNATIAQSEARDFIDESCGGNLLKYFGHATLQNISLQIQRNLLHLELVEQSEMADLKDFEVAINYAYDHRSEDLLSAFGFKHETNIPGQMTIDQVIKTIPDWNAFEWLANFFINDKSIWLKATGQAGLNVSMGQEVWTASKCLVVYEHTFLTELLPELLKSINIDSNFKD